MAVAINTVTGRVRRLEFYPRAKRCRPGDLFSPVDFMAETGLRLNELAMTDDEFREMTLKTVLREDPIDQMRRDLGMAPRPWAARIKFWSPGPSSARLPAFECRYISADGTRVKS